MSNKNKKITSLTVVGILILALILGFIFSDTQDFMSGMENQENTEQFQNDENIALISVFDENGEIEGSPVEVETSNDSDVLAYMVENFDVEGVEEGFITSINGVEQDESEGLYWLYYVNEEMPSVGAGDYIVEDGDLIEWKLESFE